MQDARLRNFQPLCVEWIDEWEMCKCLKCAVSCVYKSDKVGGAQRSHPLVLTMLPCRLSVQRSLGEGRQQLRVAYCSSQAVDNRKTDMELGIHTLLTPES